MWLCSVRPCPGAWVPNAMMQKNLVWPVVFSTSQDSRLAICRSNWTATSSVPTACHYWAASSAWEQGAETASASILSVRPQYRWKALRCCLQRCCLLRRRGPVPFHDGRDIHSWSLNACICKAQRKMILLLIWQLQQARHWQLDRRRQLPGCLSWRSGWTMVAHDLLDVTNGQSTNKSNNQAEHPLATRGGASSQVDHNISQELRRLAKHVIKNNCFCNVSRVLARFMTSTNAPLCSTNCKSTTDVRIRSFPLRKSRHACGNCGCDRQH